MSIPRIGASFQAPSSKAMLETIQRAEKLGVKGVWLTTGGGPDALTVFAAAAVTTSSIFMGTSIVPTFPRHPIVMAQQAADIAQLAPGRFALGIGPSHQNGMEGRLGIPYERPIEHLREYLTVLKTVLATEEVDFSGRRFEIHARLVYGADIPVIISALRARSFELAGELADGAVTWICPAPYIRDVALPALERGARVAGRPRPPLIAHAFVCLTEDRATMLEAAGSATAGYPRQPNYAAMFTAAGFPEAQQGTWSDAMRDSVLLHGDESRAKERVQEFLATSGADHLILSILPAGGDRQGSMDRSLRFVASL